MDNAANWSLVISGYAVTFSILASAMTYIFKHGVKKILLDQLSTHMEGLNAKIEGMEPQLKQLEKNGGSSVKDRVDKIFILVTDMSSRVVKLEEASKDASV